MTAVHSQDPTPYTIDAANDDAVIAKALAILARRVRSAGPCFANPRAAGEWLTLKAAGLEREVFGVLFLDVRGNFLAFEELFHGTLTRASVYPREVVKAALKHNANSVILTHNHPSGDPSPSAADEQLTQTLKAALGMVDCRVVDHIITAGGQYVSMAEKGLV